MRFGPVGDHDKEEGLGGLGGYTSGLVAL
jgi:hypothetical protein